MKYANAFLRGLIGEYTHDGLMKEWQHGSKSAVAFVVFFCGISPFTPLLLLVLEWLR